MWSEDEGPANWLWNWKSRISRMHYWTGFWSEALDEAGIIIIIKTLIVGLEPHDLIINGIIRITNSKISV